MSASGGGSALLPALLAGAAVAALLAPAPARLRLAALRPGAPRREPAARRGVPPVLACAVGGLAVGLLLGGVAGVLLGLAVGAGGPYALARLEPRAVREEREALAGDLPLALDLLAACLVGGAALPDALRAVSAAVPGACGVRLARVEAALAVGSDPREAWAALASSGDELAAAAARALARTAEGGAPVAPAVVRLAEQARAEARSSGLLAAERAGVLAVGPLGLCFLPAFVLLGVVPVVAGLVAPLLAGS